MAGGEGTRLRPLTSNQPKPMVPIVGRPCIEHILELLAAHAVTDVVVTLAYLPQAVRSYLGDGSSLGVSLEYSVEDTPLGTAGSVKNAAALLDETFVVISGDALTDIDLTRLVAFHRERGATATLAVKSVENPLDFGVVIADEEGRIERFLEKPGWGQVFSDTINTGIYVLEPEVLRHVPAGEPFDFSKQLFPHLLERGRPLYAYRMPDDEYWQDIGNLDQFRQANRDALDGLVRLTIPGVRLKENIWLDEGVAIGDLDQISGPSAVGRFCNIEPGARVGPYTSLGPNVVVKDGAVVTHSVIEAGSYIGAGVRVAGCVVGRSTDIHAHAQLNEGVAVGDESMIGAEAVILPDVRIYPYKTIEPGATIRQNLIWEPRGVTSLLGDVGAAGIANVEITPEVAMRLARAFGTTLKRGDRVAAARDGRRSSRMLRRAMTAGLQATGVSVVDLRFASSGLLQHELRAARLAGGLHIRAAAYDSEVVEVVFFEPSGVPAGPATRAGIERYYGRQEFRRVSPREVGEILDAPGAIRSYSNALAGLVDASAVAARRFRMVLDYGDSAAGNVGGPLFSQLGVEVIGLNAGGEEGASEGRTFEEAVAAVARLVNAAAADVGIVFDPHGERVWLVDDASRLIPSEQTLLLLLRLIASSGATGVAAVPVTVSEQVARVVEGSGVEIRRTPASPAVLMAAATEPDVVFAAEPNGAYVFPSFSASPDSLATTVKVLELLLGADRPLSALRRTLPEPTLVSSDLPCPWSVKGTAMRLLIEQTKDLETDDLDGLRIYDDGGWVQVLPDAHLPVLHLFAEGATGEDSATLEEKYRRVLERIIAGHDAR